MPKPDSAFGPRSDPQEPLYLDFVASQPESASDVAHAEDRPLHLDPDAGDPPHGRLAGTYDGFAADPAARPARLPRGLLLPGLAVVVVLGVAGALWAYAVLDHPTTAPAAKVAVPVLPAARPAQVAALDPPPVAEAPASPSRAHAPPPALREAPAPQVAAPPPPKPHEPRHRARGGGPAASAATASANIAEAFAPESTLSAQAAGP
jgi:hypothetical protein